MRSENTGVISAATLIHLEQESGEQRPRHDMEGGGGGRNTCGYKIHIKVHKILTVK